MDHNVTICSDEVWGEMPLNEDAPFHSLLSLLPPDPGSQGRGVTGLREHLILLISPSKCFNVASLDLAVSVCASLLMVARWTDCNDSSTARAFSLFPHLRSSP